MVVIEKSIFRGEDLFSATRGLNTAHASHRTSNRKRQLAPNQFRQTASNTMLPLLPERSARNSTFNITVRSSARTFNQNLNIPTQTAAIMMKDRMLAEHFTAPCSKRHGVDEGADPYTDLAAKFYSKRTFEI